MKKLDKNVQIKSEIIMYNNLKTLTHIKLFYNKKKSVRLSADQNLVLLYSIIMLNFHN